MNIKRSPWWSFFFLCYWVQQFNVKGPLKLELKKRSNHNFWNQKNARKELFWAWLIAFLLWKTLSFRPRKWWLDIKILICKMANLQLLVSTNMIRTKISRWSFITAFLLELIIQSKERIRKEYLTMPIPCISMRIIVFKSIWHLFP